MNDQQGPYDPYYQQPQIVGYDEYGQPVYQQPQESRQPQEQQRYEEHQQYGERQQYDAQQGSPYEYPEQPSTEQQYGYDPYGQLSPADEPQTQTYEQTDRTPSYDPYAQLAEQPQVGRTDQGDQSYPVDQSYAYGYDQYATDQAQNMGQQAAAVETAQWSIPQQPMPTQSPESQESEPAAGAGAEGQGLVPKPRRHEEERDYRTEQFAFIEDPDGESEDVIDWLKFTESRSERREEAKRRGRNRGIALGVVLGLALVIGLGYLVFSGGDDPKDAVSQGAGPQKRDVIVLHLHNTKKKGTSTALLVDNVTTKKGTTVLLPNSLSVASDDGATTNLGKSVEDDGSQGTREAVGALLGAKITGTWRLDTPFLENLVDLVGTIDLTTDTAVPGAKKGEAPLVDRGENQTLNGRAAVAYATYLAPGEAEAKQLERFGQVIQAVLRKFPSEQKSATVTVETLAQILDPSLTESDLGASLAKLADHAKGGDYTTATLPVQADGTLTQQAAARVKDILGGSVTAPDKNAAVRVGVRNGTGKTSAAESARVTLVNGGYAVVDGGKADAIASSQITYGDEAQRAEATEVAKTLGLPVSAVKKGTAPPNADISVVLGQDFKTN
ncbi:LCP family protein [Streptomyces albipurpureus]|uniref:LytR C-terminal domain-containing protein n=1 Tax=Streptomyces albipurpureus TaxID=2897419 RepID=A0ABT0UK45_9ACTN|nr:LytR C-terminal domain-containing protein [Streptomyces sp. CWNU-1]MCM2388475.1 LytR C-terminal domain-containing protein [Streptomyces sp. CWNU-1]